MGPNRGAIIFAHTSSDNTSYFVAYTETDNSNAHRRTHPTTKFYTNGATDGTTNTRAYTAPEL
jgi:hypothetical protein